jgi:hypothetical protein
MAADDDDDMEFPSAEELRHEAAHPGIDCLATRWAMGIAIEVMERLGPERFEGGLEEGYVSALKHLVEKDMVIDGQPTMTFSDEILVMLREDAREVIDALIDAAR